MNNNQIVSMKTFAKQLNDLTFTDYYYRIMLLARSVFRWKNLPADMDERWIEKFLFKDGACVFYRNSKLGIMVSQCNPSGELNNYEEPTSVTPVGIELEAEELKPGKDCVIIRNNDEMIPTSFPVQLFAYRLAEISRTIDINVNAQKTPVLVVTSEKQKLTLKNIYSQWNGFEPVIYGDKSLEAPELLRVLKTDAPIVFPELQIQKQKIWNECLTFLGINNANTEKRERLITDEVAANNNHIDLSADVLLKSRQKAAEQINKLFGLNISVELREDIDPEETQKEKEDEE